MSPLERTLLELEEQFWQAATDPEFYGEHFADDGLMVFPYGVGVLDKQSTIDSVRAASPWSTFRITNPLFVHLDDNCVALTYRATARREGDTLDYSAFVTSVYVQRAKAWQLAVHQQTPS